MSSRVLSVVLVAIAALLAPAVARGATEVRVEQVGSLSVVVAVDDGAAAQIETARVVDAGQTYLAVQSAGGASPATGCETVSATIVACPGQFDAVVVFGNGGNDTVTLGLIADGMSPLHGEAYGGAGDDVLRAPPDNRVGIEQPTSYMDGEGGADRIAAGNGRDELHGGDGDDTLEGWRSSDDVYGEAGNDTVSGGNEGFDPNVADLVDGGPGLDEIPAAGGDYNRGVDDTVAISMDGQPNDGEPGEGDNVVGVEKLRVEAATATVVGSAGPDDFFVLADASTIRGLGGADRLVAYDGNDEIHGGDGDDYLEGGFGNDMLDGGGGVDEFSGDRTEQDVIAVGNDRILARDGNAEQITCGIGADTAQIDGTDVVDASCESIDRKGGAGDACAKAKKKLKAAKQRLRRARKSGVAAKVKRAKKQLAKAKKRKRKACS